MSGHTADWKEEVRGERVEYSDNSRLGVIEEMAEWMMEWKMTLEQERGAGREELLRSYQKQVDEVDDRGAVSVVCDGSGQLRGARARKY